jgi:hypothetical protein
MLSFGSFPATSLSEARSRRDEARKLIETGTDPATQRKLDRLAAANSAQNTFGVVALEYLEHLKAKGAAEGTMIKSRWMLQDLAAPLTHRPIGEVTAAEVLDVLKRIEKSGRRETAKKLRGAIGSVFRLACATLRATTDPTVALRGALLRPQVKHHAAITKPQRLGELMCSIDSIPTCRLIDCGHLSVVTGRVKQGDNRHGGGDLKNGQVVGSSGDRRSVSSNLARAKPSVSLSASGARPAVAVPHRSDDQTGTTRNRCSTQCP